MFTGYDQVKRINSRKYAVLIFLMPQIHPYILFKKLYDFK